MIEEEEAVSGYAYKDGLGCYALMRFLYDVLTQFYLLCRFHRHANHTDASVHAPPDGQTDTHANISHIRTHGESHTPKNTATTG